MNITTITLLTLTVALCGCGTAKVSGRHEIGAAATGKPTTIYVSDFELDAANIKAARGILASLPKVPGRWARSCRRCLELRKTRRNSRASWLMK